MLYYYKRVNFLFKQKMKTKNKLLYALAIAGIFLAFGARAQEAQEDSSLNYEIIQFDKLNLAASDLKFDKAEYRAGETIKGTFTLQNKTKYYASGIYLEAALQRNGEDYKTSPLFYFDESMRFDMQRITDSIYINPNETKTISFSYQIPKNVVTDIPFYLQISVFGSREEYLGNVYERVSIKNDFENKYIFLNEKKSIVFGEERVYGNQEGVAFNYNKEYQPVNPKAEGQFTSLPDQMPNLKNEVMVNIAYTTEKGTVKDPDIKITSYKYGDPTKVVYSNSVKNGIEFVQGNSGYFNINLPLFEKPGTYETFIQIYDGNEKISNPIGLRYTTFGDSGMVYNFMVEKQDESNYLVQFLLAGPGDAVFRDDSLSQPINTDVTVIAKDNSGKICATQDATVNISEGISKKIPFALTNCTGPVFSVELKKDGKVLDSNSVYIDTKNVEVKNEITKEISAKTYGIIVIIILFIIAIMAIIIKIIKKKKQNTFIGFLLAGALIFSIGVEKARAIDDVYRACVEYTWNWGGRTCAKYFNILSGLQYRGTTTNTYAGRQWLSHAFNDSSDSIPDSLRYGVRAITNRASGCQWSGNCITWDDLDYTVSSGYSWDSAGNYLRLPSGTSDFNLTYTLNRMPNCGNGGPQGLGGEAYFIVRDDNPTVPVKSYQSAGRWYFTFNETRNSFTSNLSLAGLSQGVKYRLIIQDAKTFYQGQGSPHYLSYSFTDIPFMIGDPPVSLTLNKTGNGTITSDPAGINCATNPCNTTASFASRSGVTLNGPGSPYSISWGASPCSSTTSNSCTINSLIAPITINATISCTPTCNYCDNGVPDGCGGICNYNSSLSCGSAENLTTSTTPSSNLCVGGTLLDSVEQGGDSWKWNCKDACNASTVSCTAKRDLNWREVTP